MRSLHQLRGVAAILAAALALTVAGPAAARQFDINANGSIVPAQTQPPAPRHPGPCSEVCSGHGYGTGGHTIATSHRVVSTKPAPAHKSSGGFEWLYVAIAGGAVATTLAFGLAALRGRRRARPAPAQA